MSQSRLSYSIPNELSKTEQIFGLLGLTSLCQLRPSGTDHGAYAISEFALKAAVPVSATGLSSDDGRENCRSTVKTRAPGFLGLDTEADDVASATFLADRPDDHYATLNLRGHVGSV
jgi:hypothetical protein